MTDRTTDKPLLRRFTSLSVAIDMLYKQRLTLLSPSTWQDQNDVAFIEAFRQKRGVHNVFAVCFTQSRETFHHWSVFAKGVEGVKINIDKRAMLQSLQGDERFSWNDVDYKTLEEIKALKQIGLYDLPFLKRAPFGDEGEFRLIFECNDPKEKVKHMPFKPEWVTSITLSPWMHDNLVETLKEAIPKIPGCENVKLLRTSIRNNKNWKSAASRVVADTSIVAGRPRNLID